MSHIQSEWNYKSEYMRICASSTILPEPVMHIAEFYKYKVINYRG